MRVMVIGASTDPAKFGHRAVREYVRQGHEVFPVHPTAPEIAGCKAYASVDQVPGPIDRALLYLPPAVGEKLLPALAARGDVAELWVNPGAESPALIQQAELLELKPVQACAIMDLNRS